VRHPDWKPLPPCYLDPKGSRNPAGASELLEDGFKGLGWVLGKLGKGLLWGCLGIGAVVLLFTAPVGFAIIALLASILWTLNRSDD